jgi:hypothetical protein
MQNANPDKSHEASEETIERAAAEDTDPLTLLETEDALSAIPDANAELIRSEEDALEEQRSRGG